jgi:hypothetical protein
MASTYTAAGIELIADGEQSGTWGQTTNTNWEMLEEMVTGIVSVTLSATTATLTTSDGSSSDGRHSVVVFTGSPGGTCTVTVSPNDMQKVYWIVNNSDQTVTMSQGSGANVNIAAGSKKVIYCDGAGAGAAVVDLSTNFDMTSPHIDGTAVTSTAAELNLLDGSTAGTIVNSKAVVYGASGEVNATTLQIGGTSITSTAAELNILDTVTADATDLNRTDVTTEGTTEASKVVTSDSSNVIAHAGTLTLTGKTKVQQLMEKATVSATAATGTIAFDVITQQVLYYTSDASGNWTLNIRGDSSNTLNSIMSIGESVTVAFLVTQGGTAYYQSGFQVDGSSVTPEWQGGSAPTGGNTSSVDSYSITVIKTADATFTAFASQTQFA